MGKRGLSSLIVNREGIAYWVNFYLSFYGGELWVSNEDHFFAIGLLKAFDLLVCIMKFQRRMCLQHFSNVFDHVVVVPSLSHVQLFATP